MGYSGPRETGPTWNDVEAYSSDLRGRYSVHVVFRVSFYAAGKSGSSCASVVADARASNAPQAAVRATAYAAFRGTNGAKTMPAAMYLALVELEGKLAGIETVAQGKMAF